MKLPIDNTSEPPLAPLNLDPITQKHFEYLDELRECDVEMFDAMSMLRGKFPGIGRLEASMVYSSWLGTYEQRHPEST